MPLEPARATVMAMETHRSAVVEAVTEAIHRELDGQLPPFAASGKERCREDIHSHIDYIAGSLIAGSSVPFEQYLAWLRSMLEARGVPSTSLSLSVDFLIEELGARLPVEQSAALTGMLESGKAALAEPAPNGATPGTPSTTQAGCDIATTQALAKRLTSGDQDQARAMMHPAAVECGYLKMAVGLLQPALYHIGEQWQTRQISVAQEHLATALAQKLLVQEFAAARMAPATGSRAIFACVADNHHTLGLRMVADAFELGGWSVEFLGGDVPTDDLLERIEYTRPDLVGLSVSLVRQLYRLLETIDRIRADTSPAPRIVAGGLGIANVPGIADRLGLDAWPANALTAMHGT